jgi:hypothetical protein
VCVQRHTHIRIRTRLCHDRYSVSSHVISTSKKFTARDRRDAHIPNRRYLPPKTFCLWPPPSNVALLPLNLQSIPATLLHTTERGRTENHPDASTIDKTFGQPFFRNLGTLSATVLYWPASSTADETARVRDKNILARPRLWTRIFDSCAALGPRQSHTTTIPRQSDQALCLYRATPTTPT